MEFLAKSSEDMHELGRSLAPFLEDGDVVALIGSLGAGKTQFAQGVGDGLGITQKIVSPTFNIVFEYASPKITLYHFDLYRLEDESQLEDIDFYALSDSETSGASLIEWADMFPDELPDTRLDLNIEVLDDGSRIVGALASGTRAEDLLAKWKSVISK